MSAADTADEVMGANLSAAGYGSQKSWVALSMVIAAGFLPSVLMIFRSAQRRRAGPGAPQG